MSNSAPPTRFSNLQSLDSRNFQVVSTLLATLLACIVLLTLLGHKPLTNWDEGIYAEISREMLSSNPLVPHWNYQPWFEKPPLMPWITAVFFRLFGITEFWARAGSALSGVAIVALLHGWLIGRRDALAAWLSTLILLSTFGFLHVCRVGEMDVLLSFGCCIALCGLTAIQDHKLNGWYLFWAGLAIALMTKGAACIVLIFTALVFAALERWNTKHLGKAFWLSFSFFLLAVLPWHVYMVHRFGDSFLSEYLGFHVVARATHQIEDHITHWWYYFWVLLISAAPFALLYPFAVSESLRRKQFRAWSVFALVVVGFFTVIQTRLPHYIAPAYPAFAVITSVFLANRLRALRQRHHGSPRAFWIIATLLITAACLVSALLQAAPVADFIRQRSAPTSSPRRRSRSSSCARSFAIPNRFRALSSSGGRVMPAPSPPASSILVVPCSRLASSPCPLVSLPTNTSSSPRHSTRPSLLARISSSSTGTSLAKFHPNSIITKSSPDDPCRSVSSHVVDAGKGVFQAVDSFPTAS